MDLSTVGKAFERYCEAECSKEIHPNDVMYNTGAEHYFRVGESALRAIFSGLAMSWGGEPRRILDLPCGHGRVTRHLRSAFPNSKMFVCDIDAEGVDFCAENFDAEPIYSKPDLLSVDIPSSLDLIWIGSLFTHLDASRTKSWLTYLSGHLAKHGILVATFHGLFAKDLFSKWDHPLGEDWEKMASDFEESGFGYDRFKNGDMGDYGSSVSKPSWVMEAACDIPDIRIVSYSERGWANNHDVLIVTKHDRYQPF